MSHKVDFKGFQRELWNARAIIKNSGAVFVLYSLELGFIFRKALDSKLEEQLYDKKISLVGCYKKPMLSPDFIDDLEFELSQHKLTGE
jgi:hypothetical protein